MIISRKHSDYRFSCKSSFSIKNRIVIDERAAHDACLNYAGWPANEISLLIKLQRDNPDSPLTADLERSLMELPTPQVDNSNLSDREIIERVIPKYVATLSEYLKWVESLPLSAAERAVLDEQAKQQFNDVGDVDDTSSTDGNSE